MLTYINDRCTGHCSFCSNGAYRLNKCMDYSIPEMQAAINYENIINQEYNLKPSFEVFGGEAILDSDMLLEFFDLWYHYSSYNREIEWVTGMHLWEKKVATFKHLLTKYPDTNLVLALSFDGKPEHDRVNGRYGDNDTYSFEDAITLVRKELKDISSKRLFISTKKVIAPFELQNGTYLENELYVRNVTDKLINSDLLDLRNIVYAYPFYLWTKKDIDKLIDIKTKYKISNVISAQPCKRLYSHGPVMRYQKFMDDSTPTIQKILFKMGSSFNYKKLNLYNLDVCEFELGALHSACSNCEYSSLCGWTPRITSINDRNFYPYCYMVSEYIRRMKMNPPRNMSLLYCLYNKIDPYYDDCMRCIDDDVASGDALNMILKYYRKRNKTAVHDLVMKHQIEDNFLDKLLLFQMNWWSDPKIDCDSSLNFEYAKKMYERVGCYYKPH